MADGGYTKIKFRSIANRLWVISKSDMHSGTTESILLNFPFEIVVQIKSTNPMDIVGGIAVDELQERIDKSIKIKDGNEKVITEFSIDHSFTGLLYKSG